MVFKPLRPSKPTPPQSQCFYKSKLAKILGGGGEKNFQHMPHANIKIFWNGGVEFSVGVPDQFSAMDRLPSGILNHLAGFARAPKPPTPFRKFLDISMEILFLAGGFQGPGPRSHVWCCVGPKAAQHPWRLNGEHYLGRCRVAYFVCHGHRP